jgi:hypothetical protein
MARRALVLGSQIDGLRGVDNDTRRMAAMLDALGFAVDVRVGDAATRAGMLAGYDQLIAATGPDDAALVYYCGHGYHAIVPEETRSWQCIAPTDLRAGTTSDWRGITAWELSIKQTQLTAKTRNVTVILDCCHSAQLSRSDGVPGAFPRALPHPVHTGFDRHLAALRAMYSSAFDAVDPVGNPHAVRVVACGQSESAFEYPDEAGQYHGVFTEVLIDALTQVGGSPVSWAAIIGAIRARVLRRFPRQRPDIEGPARRGLFSLTQHDGARSVALFATGTSFRLSAGQLTGAAIGDIYGVPSPESVHDDSTSLAELEIVEVFPTTATARRTSGDRPIPADAVAVPLRRCVRRWPVAVDGPRAACGAVYSAIAASSTLRAAAPDEAGALGTVCIADGSMTIEDTGGPVSRPVAFPNELDRVLSQLASLGVAQGIRELEGEHGVQATELAIDLGTVSAGTSRRLPDHGAVLGLGDRYCLRIEQCTRRTLFVHALSLSARGTITLLTHFARGGRALDHRSPSITIGARADGALIGVGLHWPDGLPRHGLPRLTEFIVIATLTTTDLSGLETRDAMTWRSDGNELERVLAQLWGETYRGESCPGPLDGFLVKRLSFLLAPDPASKD